MFLKTGIAAVLIGVAALTSWTVDERSPQTRPDCPGKIVCPITGELVCKDRCPADRDRPDCPGKIRCPLTGELICKDHSPEVKEETEGKGYTGYCNFPKANSATRTHAGTARGRLKK